MLRSLMFLAILAATPLTASSQSLKGVWLGTSQRTIGGPNNGQVIAVQPRLLIYTDAFYSYAFIMGTEPRATLSDSPSDTAVAAAMQPYNASTGTYMRDGSTIKYDQIVTPNPNAMLPENQRFDREIRMLTADRLETQATDANGVTTVLIYRRVE